MLTYLLLLSIGLAAGLCGSLVGLGGGFIVVPALAFLFPDMSPSHLAGTSMAMLLCNSISSTYVYAKQKRIDYEAALKFFAASIPGSIAGALFVSGIKGNYFFISFGIFLIFVSLLLLFKPSSPLAWPFQSTVQRSFIDRSGVQFDYNYHLLTGVVISFIVGFAASLFGIGGGSLMVPTMTLLLNFPAHIAVATSMLQIFLSSIVSTTTHAILLNVDWFMLLFLAPGAIIGGQLGARLARRIPSKLLLKLLAVFLIIVSIRMMMKS